MIFHYLSATSGRFSADTFIGRLGIYGVSIFYILSGLTLYYVYYDKMEPSKDDLLSFFKKRIFRIFPLLWLVTIAAIIISRKMPDIQMLLLNLSGLFGFVKWEEYFATGVWSIGNELVFYVFFPFFIFFTKKIKVLMIALSVIIYGLYVYFAFFKLNPQLTITEQWKNYINPLNQVFLFLSGFLMGLFFHKVVVKDYFVLALLLVGLAIFTFCPAHGDIISIVTGANRIVFTASCLLICFGFYKLTFRFPPFVHKPISLLGEASYSIYLLHPIVYRLVSIGLGVCSRYLFKLPTSAQLIFSIIATLILSNLVYQHFEKYFMGLARTTRKSVPESQTI